MNDPGKGKGDEPKVVWSEDWEPKSVNLGDMLVPDGKGGHKWFDESVTITPPDNYNDKAGGE